MHHSDKAVDPPGDARPDLDIWLDYARRMDFRDRDGHPLVGWHDAESAFTAWQECSRGRPCDYTGLSYERLRDADGIQWPVTRTHPDGTERLYTDGITWAAPDACESYGKDLTSGDPASEAAYRELNPEGRAVLRSAAYVPPHQPPDPAYPLQLNTGRTLYHFHTRTKTGRAPQLNAAAPEVWWSSPPRRPAGTALPRATWSRPPAPAGPYAAGCGSPTSATAWCSCRSITATGTPTRARARTGPPAGP